MSRELARRFNRVADTLDTLNAWSHPHVLKMELHSIWRLEERWSFACIAGSYLLAKAGGEWSSASDDVSQFLTLNGRKVDYTDGAVMMAEDLGFNTTEEFREWAEENPGLWGNECGYLLFESRLPWGGEADTNEDSELSIADCVRHLRGVATRITAKEEAYG